MSRPGSPLLICTAQQQDTSSAVVLNREYTCHLGVRGAKAGGTKHQSLQGLAH